MISSWTLFFVLYFVATMLLHKNPSNPNINKFQERTIFLEDFKDWTAFDLIFDFYRIRNANVLAINDIETKEFLYWFYIFLLTSKKEAIILIPPQLLFLIRVAI